MVFVCFTRKKIRNLCGLVIRLQPSKKFPKKNYRIVVADQKKSCFGNVVAVIGNYIPSRNSVAVYHIDYCALYYWLSVGAIPKKNLFSLLKWVGCYLLYYKQLLYIYCVSITTV